ncbi:Putative uncharacterized protein [Lactococcus lactis subsp. lactis A12]|uniref:Uncharacterized protein n=1 Tax=Lactococcus lactis subsp. lactis A12 TaxID=1137134 RepID=S6F4U7_LACLL|nr:Putative uncharacterized protein [Lactococcus lactis subsp. lactis A12]SBW30081.1 Hypothetical protein LLA12_00928 [Lactococcus lactis subsp. lactis]
MVHNEIPTKL